LTETNEEFVSLMDCTKLNFPTLILVNEDTVKCALLEKDNLCHKVSAEGIKIHSLSRMPSQWVTFTLCTLNSGFSL